METTENAWELICSAAFHDGVTVTVRPSNDKYIPAVEVVFTRRGLNSAVSIEMTDRHTERHAQATMHGLRYALFRLLEHPYREIGKDGGSNA